MAETVTVRDMRLVSPRGTDLSSGEFHLNERPSELSGKTLGLLENHKANSDKVLQELGEITHTLPRVARVSPRRPAVKLPPLARPLGRRCARRPRRG